MAAEGNASTMDAAEETLVEATPAVSIRIIGWTMLSLMAAFLINVVLTFWADWPGIGQLFGWLSNGDGSTAQSAIQLALYIISIPVAIGLVMKTKSRTLRDDEKLTSDICIFVIRACFWIVLLVGMVDMVISFLRVEGLLEAVVGADLTGDLGRSQYRGLFVHTPLVVLGIILAKVTRTLGFHWLALLVVGAELLIVFSRFVFSYEQAFMADLVRFWYGALFLFASAYTLLDDGHVRVDLLYAGFRHKTKGKVNRWGAVFLGIPLCWTILLMGMWSKSAVIVSPILVFEVTQAGFGLYIKYFMAGFLGIFAVSMMIQFVSQFFGATADTRGEAGGRVTGHEVM